MRFFRTPGRGFQQVTVPNALRGDFIVRSVTISPEGVALYRQIPGIVGRTEAGSPFFIINTLSWVATAADRKSAAVVFIGLRYWETRQ